MKAVIPAAGLGTRFLPATKSGPKELLPILDKPVIQYVVEEALEPDCVDSCIVVSSPAKSQIENFFSRDEKLERLLESQGKYDLAETVRKVGQLPVTFAYQENPRGLGHAVLCAAPKLDHDPFFVLLGDYFVPNRQMCVRMIEVSKAHGGASVIAVTPVDVEDVSRYGVIAGEYVESYPGTSAKGTEAGAIWRVSGLVEKPKPKDAPTNLCIVGRYLLAPSVLYLLRTQSPGAGGEIQLTDALQRLLDEEEMYALVVDPAEGCDTGTPASWAATNARLALGSDKYAKEFRDALQGASL